MRYVTARLHPQGVTFDPAEAEVQDTDSLRRIAIHHWNVLTDESVVLLEEMRGEHDAIASIYGSRSEIQSYDIVETEGGTYLYLRFNPSDAVLNLLRVSHEHEVLVDSPIEYCTDGGLRLTLVGTQSELQKILERVPDTISVEIEQLGEYKPQEEQLFDKLTFHQQEVLSQALQMGYFEEPRQTTTDEIADELDISPSAVSKHLRRIQSSVLSSIVPGNR